MSKGEIQEIVFTFHNNTSICRPSLWPTLTLEFNQECVYKEKRREGRQSDLAIKAKNHMDEEEREEKEAKDVEEEEEEKEEKEE